MELIFNIFLMMEAKQFPNVRNSLHTNIDDRPRRIHCNPDIKHASFHFKLKLNRIHSSALYQYKSIHGYYIELHILTSIII